MALACEQAKVDAFCVSLPQDVSYLTGFTGDDSFLVFGCGWAVLVTDGRYDEQARNECPDLEIHLRDSSMAAGVAKVLKGRGVRRMGVQGGHLTVNASDTLGKHVGANKLRPLTGVLAQLRVIKDADEIAAIRKSVRVAERAFKALIARGAKGLIGRSENEVAAELEYHMRRFGASGAAFDTIVAAGPHGSQPHYRPNSTKIVQNEPVLIDWGAKTANYCSDLTRVVFTGRIPPKLAELYEVVLRAQSAGISAIKPGVACKTVDSAARQVITSAGYGEHFTHGLGHGLGRLIHEAPGLSSKVDRRLKSGMVVTVEPGIYIPGLGGIRIEDDVLVTPQGARRITTLPRKLAAMQLH